MHIAEVVTIAKSLPLLRLNTYKSLILSYSADYRRIFRKGKTIALYCRSGKRSKKAARILSELHYKVVELDGGYLEWTKAGQ